MLNYIYDDNNRSSTCHQVLISSTGYSSWVAKVMTDRSNRNSPIFKENITNMNAVAVATTQISKACSRNPAWYEMYFCIFMTLKLIVHYCLVLGHRPFMAFYWNIRDWICRRKRHISKLTTTSVQWRMAMLMRIGEILRHLILEDYYGNWCCSSICCLSSICLM